MGNILDEYPPQGGDLISGLNGITENDFILIDPADSRYYYSGSCWGAVEPSYDFHFSHEGEEIVTIHHDGKLEFGENYTPDAAAEMFWNNIAMQSPQALKQRIEELEAQVSKLQTEKEVLEYHLKDADGEKRDSALDDMIVIREPVDIPPRKVRLIPVDAPEISSKHVRVVEPKKVHDDNAFERAMKVVE